MKPVRMAVLLGILLALGVVSLSAQPVISAKSGVIAYVEGNVFLGDQAVEYSVTKFPEMKENSVLRTEDGRAEVLLTPGVLLRLGENSSLKLLTNRLIDTRLELQSGSAVVEADMIGKDNNVTLVCKNGTAALSKAGIYRFDANPGSLKVFKGEASLQMSGSTVLVGAGRMAMLDGASASVQKFNAEETDALDHWSHRRGEYVALANASAAKQLMDNGGYSSYAPYLGVGLGGYPYGYGMGLNNCMNAWAFNQWYGMYTFMPCRGYFNSPYGYPFWSPYAVTRVFYSIPGGGYNAGGHSGPRTAAAFTGARGGYSYGGTARTSSGPVAGVGSYGSFARGSAGGYSGGGGFSGGGASSGGGAVSSSGGGVGGHGGGAGGSHGGR